jgi:hypothetical protein
MLFDRFNRSTPAPTPAPVDAHRPCDELGAIATPFSPLIGELLALYCHTRPLGALSQDESCPQEYQLIARSVIHHVIEGWQNQTGGRGTIEDLLLQPRRAPVRERTTVSDLGSG